MNAEHLVRMANAIGDFFAAWPDAQQAQDGIATHIRKFWEPRMRRGIFEHIDRAQGAGLKPIVLQALLRHRGELV